MSPPPNLALLAPDTIFHGVAKLSLQSSLTGRTALVGTPTRSASIPT